MLGLFAVNRLSVQGGVLQMVNHGLSTGGLFAVVGMIYERYHTRQIADFGGLARRLPVLAFFMLVLTLSSIAVPGLNGFAGEFLILLGMFQRGWAAAPADHWLQFRAIAVLAVSGVILGAWYMLWMYQRVFFGPLREPEPLPDHPPVRDLSGARSAAWRRWWCSSSGSACSRGSSSTAWRRRWMPWWPRRCRRSTKRRCRR